jgi:asparagine synthase (glutamine-hydrolysing)
MTLIAGIFSRTEQPLAHPDCESLRQLISRNPIDQVKTFKDNRSFFASVDIGAFCEPGSFIDANGALSLVAGEPLLRNGGLGRLEDLRVIHQALRNNWSVLREAEGTFCLVHYQPETGTLFLAADKLGNRPLYLWIDEQRVVFATALRILEGLSFVPKKMDLRAVTEVVAFGAPLGDRTPYSDIFMLKPAEIVAITDSDISRKYYWRWDEIAATQNSESECLARVYDRFQNATRRRNRNDKISAAYLSGGLDSRCVVAALYDLGVRTCTVNFARPGSQDYYFGNDFAEQIGSVHLSIPKERGDSIPDYSSLMAQTLRKLKQEEWPAERPRLVWSGEGGSVLLGHVHLNESIVESMRAGKTDRAIEAYVQREQIDVPVKLFQPKVLASVGDVIAQGIREELDHLHAEDPGRNFYLFLMRNDQRRKLTGHFENIDLHRLEFQLPFFDGEFLTSVMATPLDWCLRHKFYLKWLSYFPPPVAAVPWQAYPGHEPCPLPVPAELTYQWDSAYQAEEEASQKQKVIAQAGQLLRSIDFPRYILKKRNLRLATWMHSRGWRDYKYAIEAAQTYHRYAQKCGGEFTFSPK